MIKNNQTVNLEHLNIMIADANEPARRVLHTMLHSFGATHIAHASNGEDVKTELQRATVDLLICDITLDDSTAPELIKKVRQNRNLQARFIPIMITCGHSAFSDIARCRDVGANIVVKKPLSVQVLYDRLCWIAHKPRPFVDEDSYCGPCRRFKIEGFPNGVGRRAGDKPLEVADSAGPSMSQDEVDSFFNTNNAS
ncbi:MAG: response regulator [Pseudomonadota bacterium]|nr:response regulator [Pseudomonadota bacterium]